MRRANRTLRRMTDTERERDLRRRNINPHAPCAIADTGTPANRWGTRCMWLWTPFDRNRCHGGAVGQHMPDCETGEEMSFAEWLRRDAERAWQRAWQLRRRRLMQIMGES